LLREIFLRRAIKHAVLKDDASDIEWIEQELIDWNDDHGEAA
jgi:hypothetical protein